MKVLVIYYNGISEKLEFKEAWVFFFFVLRGGVVGVI